MPTEYQALAPIIVIACAVVWMMFVNMRFLKYAADFWGNQCATFSTHLMPFPDAFREAAEEAIEAGKRHPIMRYHRRFSHLDQFPEALRHAPGAFGQDEKAAKNAVELELEEDPHDPGERYRRLLWRIFGGPDDD